MLPYLDNQIPFLIKQQAASNSTDMILLNKLVVMMTGYLADSEENQYPVEV